MCYRDKHSTAQRPQRILQKYVCNHLESTSELKIHFYSEDHVDEPRETLLVIHHRNET